MAEIAHASRDKNMRGASNRRLACNNRGVTTGQRNRVASFFSEASGTLGAQQMRIIRPVGGDDAT